MKKLLSSLALGLALVMGSGFVLAQTAAPAPAASAPAAAASEAKPAEAAPAAPAAAVAAPAAPAAPAPTPEDILLLREIRDLLKK